ncbi:conserved hypothetical protein [delta proteobacterium NaphS2]|nr:conserved hypothetical protein [delta proteobacterium NaphS2]
MESDILVLPRDLLENETVMQYNGRTLRFIFQSVIGMTR